MEGYQSGVRGDIKSDEKNKIRLEDIYKPSRRVQEKIFDVYEKFLRWRSLREQPYKQFNGIQMSEYLQRSREKFWGWMPLSFDNDVPQFFFPETRNQVIGVLSEIANLRLKPSFEGTQGFNLVKATLLKDLFEYWQRSTNEKLKSFWNFLYTIVNGTCIVFVAYRDRERKVREITEYDPHTGESKWKERDIDDSEIVEEIVNLEDFYVPKIWEPNLQDQEEVIWRTLIKWSDFKNSFAGYELMDTVVPGMQFADNSIFSQFLSYDVRGGDYVEIIRYFNVPKDEYMIIANGVLLNPVRINGEDNVSPLPWNHKELPFAKTVFEPIDPTFFYGMPLAMKVKTPQEVLNIFWELGLEREKRSVTAPIITNDPTMELGLDFKAGHIYQVQGDVDQYKEMSVSPMSGSYWNLLTSLQGIISRTGSGGLSPIMPSRQPRAATEKALEAQHQQKAAGFYTLFYQDLLEQISWLVLQNMIQFYTSSRVEKTLGTKKFNKILSLVDVELVGGGRGNREIRITDSPEKSAILAKEAYERSLVTKERVEIVEVTPESVRELKFDLQIDFEVEETPQQERALYMDFILTLVKLFGQQQGLLDPKKVMFRMIDKFGENPSDFIPDTLIRDYENERFGFTSEKSPAPGGFPELNDMNQAMRGMQNGAGGPAQQMGGPLQTAVPPKTSETIKGQRPEGKIM